MTNKLKTTKVKKKIENHHLNLPQITKVTSLKFHKKNANEKGIPQGGKMCRKFKSLLDPFINRSCVFLLILYVDFG